MSSRRTLSISTRLRWGRMAVSPLFTCTQQACTLALLLHLQLLLQRSQGCTLQSHWQHHDSGIIDKSKPDKEPARYRSIGRLVSDP